MPHKDPVKRKLYLRKWYKKHRVRLLKKYKKLFQKNALSYYYRNREKKIKWQKEYYRTHKKQHRVWWKKYHKYHPDTRRHVDRVLISLGIHIRYDDLVKKQKRKCLICRRVPRKLVIDHSHRRNQFRGLLCQRCNIMLGASNDNSSILRRAMNYLERR